MIFLPWLLLFFCTPVLFASDEAIPLNSSKEQAFYVIGGSIGGVETDIGLFKSVDNNIALIQRTTKKTKELPTQESLNSYISQHIQQLRKEHQIDINLAAFAVSGPTQRNMDCIQSSHMSYPVNGSAIATQAQLAKVLVINDFEMGGYALPFLAQENVETLHKGVPQIGKPKALIGAGTGLGSCLLVPHEATAHTVLPMGLNMTAFCPLNEKEIIYFEFLKRKQSAQKPHVGWGTALGSKGGLAAIFQCFHDKNSSLTAQDIFAKSRIKNDAERDNSYSDAVAFYLSLYARAIRTFMLLTLPYDGIYITNSVAQDNPDFIRSKKFIHDILSSGNNVLDAMLQTIPIYLVTDNSLPIRGAAVLAAAQNK